MVPNLYGTSAHVETFQVFQPSPSTTCFVLLVMGLGPRFCDSPLRAPHCGFCSLGCGLLFALQSFLFSSLVPLPGVFPLIIYLFINWRQLVRNYLWAGNSEANARARVCWVPAILPISQGLLKSPRISPPGQMIVKSSKFSWNETN